MPLIPFFFIDLRHTLSNKTTQFMNWNVLYVNSRAEAKVAERLKNQGFQVFCPMQEVVRQWSDRKKKVKVPYFPSYVFVCDNNLRRLEILQTPGVVGFVYWLHKPAVIREKEMKMVMDFFKGHAHSQILSKSFEPGQNLVIKHGPLKEKKGVVVRQGKNKVVLQIQQLGIALTAVLPKNAVAEIEA